MTQNNKNLAIVLQNFFNKHPDIRGTRNKGLVNRRALAKYIIDNESLDKNRFEALLTALRRFEVNPEAKSCFELFKRINVSTKDRISIIYLEKSDMVLKNISKLISVINFNKNETLKFVQGSLSLKLFVDEFNLKKIENIFSDKDIIKIYNRVSELNLIFDDKVIKTRGVISYLTSELSVSNINIIELLTGKPELIVYVDESDLLKAYEAIMRLKEHS